MQTPTTMALKLYPIGIQTFERIRKEDKLYIDKTEFVYRMTHTNGTYFFLSRPRRFGKSLLVSTLQSDSVYCLGLLLRSWMVSPKFWYAME